MPDRFTSEKRSDIMSRIKGRDTGPEKRVRSLLHRMGYRFRLRRKDLPGKPDIVLPKYRTVIFVHGCFWHGHAGCKRATRPATNVEFWNAKIDRNIKRDAEVRCALEGLGWRVLVIWECELKNIELVATKLSDSLPSRTH